MALNLLLMMEDETNLSWMSLSITWRHFFLICTSADKPSLLCFSKVCLCVSCISTATRVTILADSETLELSALILLEILYNTNRIEY